MVLWVGIEEEGVASDSMEVRIGGGNEVVEGVVVHSEVRSLAN